MPYDNEINIELGEVNELCWADIDNIENEKGEIVDGFYITSQKFD